MIPKLTELSLGCAQLGNLHRAITDEDAAATVLAAWDGGVRYFDTAPHYGLGLSERRLGASLADRPRADYVLSTKVGRLLEPLREAVGLDADGFDVAATHRGVWDFSCDGIMRSLAGSVERLGLDRVDVVYLHDPDEHYREALEVAYPALEELRAQGVVSFMLAGRYTLLEQPPSTTSCRSACSGALGSSPRACSTAGYSLSGGPPRTRDTTTSMRPRGSYGGLRESRMSASGTGTPCPPQHSPSRRLTRRS